MKMERYRIDIDNELECYRIIDVQTLIDGDEYDDCEWVATAYTEEYANSICHYLNWISKAGILS